MCKRCMNVLIVAACSEGLHNIPHILVQKPKPYIDIAKLTNKLLCTFTIDHILGLF